MRIFFINGHKHVVASSIEIAIALYKAAFEYTEIKSVEQVTNSCIVEIK